MAQEIVLINRLLQQIQPLLVIPEFNDERASLGISYSFQVEGLGLVDLRWIITGNRVELVVNISLIHGIIPTSVVLLVTQHQKPTKSVQTHCCGQYHTDKLSPGRYTLELQE